MSQTRTRISKVIRHWSFYVHWFQVRGDCLFCWYPCNCWPSQFELSFYKTLILISGLDISRTIFERFVITISSDMFTSTEPLEILYIWLLIRLVWFMVFNATFNNISVISLRRVLLVGETGVPRENQRHAASHWQTLSYNVVSSTPRLRGVRSHNVLTRYTFISLISPLQQKLVYINYNSGR
jgi:hypothetical protein